jgi:hypothetical protein
MRRPVRRSTGRVPVLEPGRAGLRMTPPERYERTELAGLQDRMRDIALIIEDRDLAEQVLRLTGVVVRIHALHTVDDRKRCLLCRSAGRRLIWRRRQLCTVREVLEAYRLGGPSADVGVS